MSQLEKVDESYSQAEATTVAKAIRFTNSSKERDYGSDEWKVREYKRLNVLPRKMPYFIDDVGRVHGRFGNETIDNAEVWAAASSHTLVRYREKLDSLLRVVVLDPYRIPDQAYQVARRPDPISNAETKVVEALKDLHFPIGGWSRFILKGVEVKIASESYVTPTIRSFVGYASILIATSPWAPRIARCTVCEKYFVNKPGRRGPRRQVCGPRCDEKRGDPGARDRARRSHQRRREESDS